MRKQNRIRHLRTGTLAAVMTALVMLLTALLPCSVLPAAAGTGYSDTELTVSGLDNNDTANFYQFVQWSNDGWKYTKAFQDLIDKQGTDQKNALALQTVLDGEITHDLAGLIASMILTGGLQPAGTADAVDGKASFPLTSTTDKTELGIYCVIVEPEKAETLYNPIFVSADFITDEPNHNGIDVSKNVNDHKTLSGAYSDEVIAKKVKESLTKSADKISFALDDTIHYTVTTNIPAYTKAYSVNKRTFVVSDTLSNYETFDYTISTKDQDFKVMVDGVKAVRGDHEDYTLQIDDEVVEKQQKVSGWTINFTQEFMDDPSNWGQPVVITYSVQIAKGLKWSDQNLVAFDNTARITFHNNPKASDEDVKKIEEDTRHYTYGIGGLVNGGGRYHEIVKAIGANASVPYNNQQSVNSTDHTVTYTVKDKGETKAYRALPGAKFIIYKDENCTEAVKRNDVAYTCETGSDGIFVFTGLDAGTYYIQEAAPPKGYIQKTGTIKVEFSPTYVSRITNGHTKEDDLTQYTVTTNNGTECMMGEATPEPSTVIFLRQEEVDNIEDVVLKPAGSGDMQANVGNVSDKDLPSTGGIGTGIFYLIGGILLAAALFLALKSFVRMKH